MKKLYTFVLNKEIEIEEPQISKNDKGEEIKVLVKIKKQEPHSYFIAKPTRSLMEAAEVYYASIVSKCIAEGIFSVNLLQKRILNDGGVFSEEQKKEYAALYELLFDKQALHRKLKSTPEEAEKNKEEADKVFNELTDILAKIQNIEAKAGNNAYQNTAENIARNRCSVFWTLNLSYKEENGKEIPAFPGKTYEDKLNAYDYLEENGSDFDIEVIKRLFFVTSLWYLGKADTQEDFDTLVKLGENQGIIDLASNNVNETK